VVFSAPTFLFVFLPVVLALVLLAPRSMRNVVLLAASLFFYAWGEAEFVVVMLASIGFNYCAGLCLEPSRSRASRQAVLALGIGGNLLLLCWFKYAGFIAANLMSLALALDLPESFKSIDGFDAIHLPIGISFFTFQAISYLVDVYRGEHPPQRRPIHLALFISLFPQLIAGPIVRYKDISHQLTNRRIDREGFAEGIRRFTIGLSKKLLIANSLAIPADAIFALSPGQLTPSVAWFGALCYTLQIYFDFSGYSDMAIGLGRFFGFTIPENFNRPYRARSLTDFWRRWHLSLSRWFRDYLYIPLGGNRQGSTRTYANLLIVFVLCGLWHGASWTFLAWGLLHGSLLMFERAGFGERLVRAPRLVAHLYCLFAVVSAWVLFRAESLAHAVAYLSSMIGAGASTSGIASSMIADFVSSQALVALAVGSVWASGVLDARFERIGRPEIADGHVESTWARRLQDWASTPGLVALWSLCAMKLATRTYDPFLYFRF
jgi:alginate O-acetyltransferase complex protein AlgI